MCTDDTFDTYESPDDSSTDQGTEPVAETEPKSGWNRRTFLKAAALGTAAAALLGRSHLDASSVLAHEDTKSSCTANDIEVTGGQIINEPCTCAEGGTFEAVAKFLVINQNNATRKCITLHLGPTGGSFGGKDFLLTTDPSGDPTKGTSNIGGLGTSQFMYANTNYI